MRQCFGVMIAATASGFKNSNPIREAQNKPISLDRLEQLIEVDASICVLHRNGISQLDQIFLLNGEQHLAHTFRLFLAWEFDDEQIGKGGSSSAMK